MKKYNLTILVLIALVLNSFSNVNPRYNAIVKLKKFELNHKQVETGIQNNFNIKYYEESEIYEFCISEKYSFGMRFMGRPVWRKGLIKHEFEYKILYRDNKSDKWINVSENFAIDYDKAISEFYESPISFTGEFGHICYSLSINMQLLNEKYEVEDDSNYLSKFVLSIEKMRINGISVQLLKTNFEELYKKSGKINIGSIDDSPVYFYFTIEKGTAENINKFKYELYYCFVDSKTGEEKKEKLPFFEPSKNFANDYMSIQRTTNEIEELYINIRVKAYKI